MKSTKKVKVKEAIEYINNLQADMERQHPFMEHSAHWWGWKVAEEGVELAFSTTTEPTPEELLNMKKEGADVLLSLLRWFHSIGVQPSEIFEIAISKHQEVRERARNGYYPRQTFD